MRRVRDGTRNVDKSTHAEEGMSVHCLSNTITRIQKVLKKVSK